MTEVTPAAHRLRRVAPLALVIVLATACGDDNKGTATPKTPPGTTTATTKTVPSPPPPTGGGAKTTRKGKLVMGKRNLFPLLKTSLRRFAPTQVEGKSLLVVALAGPESFWAGRNLNQRILVAMRLKGEDTPKITIGQKVDFVGLLTASPADAGAVGVRRSGDKTLLALQGAYVFASALDVKLR
jgi:hypothetical protein